MSAQGDHSMAGGDQAESRYGGEVNSLVDVYTKHERRIYRYCLALLRNPDDAEDATQETFTRAAPFLPNLAGDLSAYLTTVARNICCDVVRARSRRPVPLDNVALPDRAVSPERQSIDWDVVRRMWRQLSPSERLLFAYTFAGYRYEEIASRTGMSRPSVSVGLTRARRRLRDLATAIGALGLLPLGIRRLLDRLGQRAQVAVANGQQLLLVAAEQAAAITATIIAGLIGVGATGPGVAVLTGTAPTAYRMPAPGPGSTAAAVGPSSAAASTPLAAPAPKHTVRPAPAPAPDPVGALLPGGAATVDQVNASSVTTSPDFEHDGIAFMVGGIQTNCGNVACTAAFRSGDAGATWTRVWSTSFKGGTILLSPHFPADPEVFVLDSGVGLTASPAGDGVFSTVVPGASVAAVDPGSAPGRARVAVVDHGVVMTYTEGATAALPGPALPPQMTATAIAFSGPQQVVVSGWQVDPAAPGLALQDATLVTCSLSGICGTPLTFPQDHVLQLASGPGADTPVVAWEQGGDALVSTDHGATFHQIVRADSQRPLWTAAVGAVSGGWRLVFTFTNAAARTTTVSYSDDLGASLVDATGDLHSTGLPVAGQSLPDGNLLVALAADPHRHFALDESTGNQHWAAASSF